MPSLLVPGEALPLRELAERWTAAWPELRPLDHLDVACAVARGALDREPIQPGVRVYRYSLAPPAPRTSP